MEKIKSKQSIFLIGFMGSGKTTIGKILAKKMEYSFLDTDKIIEQEEGISVNKIFEQFGEKYFRSLEKLVLKRIIKNNVNQIVATGGGLSCNQYNMDLMKQNGKVVFLEIDPKSILNRVKNAKQKRPILDNLSEKKLISKIDFLLHKRNKYYTQADFIVKSIHVKNEIDYLIKMF